MEEIKNKLLLKKRKNRIRWHKPIDKVYIDRSYGSKTGNKMIWYDHFLTVCVHCILNVQEFILYLCINHIIFTSPTFIF